MSYSLGQEDPEKLEVVNPIPVTAEKPEDLRKEFEKTAPLSSNIKSPSPVATGSLPYKCGRGGCSVPPGNTDIDLLWRRTFPQTVGRGRTNPILEPLQKVIDYFEYNLKNMATDYKVRQSLKFLAVIGVGLFILKKVKDK